MPQANDSPDIPSSRTNLAAALHCDERKVLRSASHAEHSNRRWNKMPSPPRHTWQAEEAAMPQRTNDTVSNWCPTVQLSNCAAATCPS
eukprot:9235353-Pyramimonas_sp.AAC.1